MRNRLSAFQLEVLDAFFRRASGFFLTGGAALAGFHLGHRETQDLDLFTTEDRLDDGASVLRAVADELGASIESLRTSPDFRRFLLRRAGNAVVVDLVRDRAPQGTQPKPVWGTGPVRVDPAGEILANKLAALLSRGEVRDLVDVRALLGTGLAFDDAFALAQRKDGGLTPAQLSWVLSQVHIDDGASIPGGVTPPELRAFLDELVAQLARRAFPSGGASSKPAARGGPSWSGC